MATHEKVDVAAGLGLDYPTSVHALREMRVEMGKKTMTKEMVGKIIKQLRNQAPSSGGFGSTQRPRTIRKIASARNSISDGQRKSLTLRTFLSVLCR